MTGPTERLPWLHQEPTQSPEPPAQRKKAGSMWPWYLLLLVLVGAVGAGAWWLNTGRDAAPPELPAEDSLPIPATESQPAESGNALASSEVVPENLVAPAPLSPPVPSRPSVVSQAAERQTPTPLPRAQPKVRASARSILPPEEPSAAIPPSGPDPIVTANASPYRGRVVQLGAFPTRTQAEDNWKRITRRYPYLTTKAKMVNTVDVRGLGGGRPTRMYRLQLGTSSQAQSVVICQQLERAGHSCVVVY